MAANNRKSGKSAAMGVEIMLPFATRRFLAQNATRILLLCVVAFLTAEIWTLAGGGGRDRYEHPTVEHDEQVLAPLQPALSNEQIEKVLAKKGAKLVEPPPDLLFLAKNTHFNKRSVRIPTPSNSTAKLDSGASANTRRFSHFRCIGNDNDPDGRRERICLFENVCYSLEKDEFTYHIRNTSRKPILFDSRNGERFDFWESNLNGRDYKVGFVALSGFTEGSTDWAPLVSVSPSPAVTSPSTTVTLNSLHSIFQLAVHDDNLGHVLWEELGMLWYGMIRLNAYSDNLVAMHALEPLPNRKLSQKFRDAFFGAITPNAPVNLVEYLKKMAASKRGAKYVCFDQLMAGGNMLRFFQTHAWHNQGHEPLFYALRNRILGHHGIDYRAVPKTHKIVFTNKTETLKKNIDGGLAKNRGISNLAELVAHVKRRYPSVAIEVVEWQKLSVKKQLELMHSTTVFITPCGGVSTMLPFLPEGGHAIIIDYFERNGEAYYGTQPGTSVSMEAPMWNHFPHVKKLYYQVWKASDFVSDVPGKAIEELDWRYEASVNVDFERMDKLIEAAFEDMEA
ncbi:hypothetical protein BC830DRAFT_1163288 [Chytriomyces sp. MP71]|nr:hypothetical protein BC830DRAFT_1163288 [Chytriomyces sp. MP71]